MASLCTAKVLRDYFLNNQLPENGIVCPTDEMLFPPTEVTSTEGLLWLKNDVKTYPEDDLELLKTVKELGKAWKPDDRAILL